MKYNILKKFNIILITFILSLSLNARKGDTFSVNETVMAKLDSEWLKATVLKREDDQYYIHFNKKTEDDDQWLSIYQMEKMSRFGTDFKTSKKNTRSYKIKVEVKYFCQKSAQWKKIKGRQKNDFLAMCNSKKLLKSNKKRPSPIVRFNPEKSLTYNIHKACLGEFNQFCADKCGYHTDKSCLPQCMENVERCKNTFYYDNDLNKFCNSKGAAQWQMKNYNKNYNKGGRSIWILPKIYFDDRKDPRIYACAKKYALIMDHSNDCIQLERCNAICQVDPKSQNGASTVKTCKKICRTYFPKRKCNKPILYSY